MGVNWSRGIIKKGTHLRVQVVFFHHPISIPFKWTQQCRPNERATWIETLSHSNWAGNVRRNLKHNPLPCISVVYIVTYSKKKKKLWTKKTLFNSHTKGLFMLASVRRIFGHLQPFRHLAPFVWFLGFLSGDSRRYCIWSAHRLVWYTDIRVCGLWLYTKWRTFSIVAHCWWIDKSWGEGWEKHADKLLLAVRTWLASGAS